MVAPVPHVTEVIVLGHYRLRVTFDDGLTGEVDLSDLQDAGPVFEPLRDPECFARAFVDPVGRTVTWPGEIDLDPESLYEQTRLHPAAA